MRGLDTLFERYADSCLDEEGNFGLWCVHLEGGAYRNIYAEVMLGLVEKVTLPT